MADFTDKTITCTECGNEFVWSADEQKFYAEKGFENAPKRCPDCRRRKKASFNRQREMFPATCAKCGKETQVPFKPKGDRPVYCRECFAETKNQG